MFARTFLLLTLVSTAESFSIKPVAVRPLRPRRTNADVQMSVPSAYAGAAAVLAWRATQAATRADVGVLVSTLLCALIDLAPTAAAQLASSKRAIEVVPPAPSGAARERRYAAKKWRSLVSFKLIGHFAGLVWMLRALDPAGVIRGAALIFATNLSFWLLGAGAARHDADGKWAPVPDRVTRAICGSDALICAIAAAASICAPGSPRFDRVCKLYSIFVIISAIENVPNFAKGLPVWLGLKPAQPPPLPPSLGGPTD